MAQRSPQIDPTKILVLVEQQSVAELVKLTLNHGVCVTREVSDGSGAMALLDEWRPDLAVIEAEIAGGDLLQRIARTGGTALGRHSRPRIDAAW